MKVTVNLGGTFLTTVLSVKVWQLDGTIRAAMKKEKHYCGSVVEVALFYRGLAAAHVWHKTLAQMHNCAARLCMPELRKYHMNFVVLDTP